MKMADQVAAEEARALAGMFVHRRLAVPSGAFQHPGRRCLVAAWEEKGIGTQDIAALGKIVPQEMLAEAVADIEMMAQLMDVPAVWEGVCDQLNRRYRIHTAKEDAARILDDFNRNQSTATALAAAVALQRFAEAEAPEIHAPTGAELFDRMMAEAVSTQGRRFLGMEFLSLPLLNARMDGLRGLTFLAGSPGTGKTSLALQLAFDAAEVNPDTVVLFLTCEMSVRGVQASLVTSLTKIPFQELMKGRPGTPRDPSGMMLREVDIKRLAKARERIAGLGHRWHVVQPSDVGGAFTGSKRGGAGVFAPITALANRAKQISGASRMLVVVDSLQRVPVAEPVSGSVTGWMGEAIERDIYVVAALNDLSSGVGDAVLCISEQNKAQQGTASITSMRGTGTLGYACDSSLMLTDAEEYAEKDGGTERKDADARSGFRWVEAHLVKGRHGSQRGMERLRFDFHTHAFTEGGR